MNDIVLQCVLSSFVTAVAYVPPPPPRVLPFRVDKCTSERYDL